MENKKHIILDDFKEVQEYKPNPWRWPSLHLPPRDRHAHGQRLLSDFSQIEESDSFWVSNRNWRYIEFSSSWNFDLKFWSLETKRSWIDLLNTKIIEKENWEIITKATVFIPYWKEDIIKNKIKKYENENSNKWKPKNEDLVAWIESIKNALLASFWTDIRPLSSITGNKDWYEIWLNIEDDEKKEENKQKFINTLTNLDIKFKNSYLQFPENLVMVIQANKNELENIILHSEYLSEIKLAKEVSSIIWNSSKFEQSEWTDELLSRININDSNSRVFVLDTWINDWHPLLQNIVDKKDSVDSSWWDHDHEWHWTEMAWIVAYWDFIQKIQSSDKVNINHKVWSIKILPPKSKWETPKELWWDFTKRAISKAEIISPTIGWNSNSYCLAVTAEDDTCKWRPTSWSASIDQIAYNNWDNWRNIVISTWNSNIWNNDYPDFCKLSEIEDPAQAWNALTVWAFTSKCWINQNGTFYPIAKNWEMSPHNRTSFVFSKWWPIKPEIVFEWWNLLKWWMEHPDLDLLTTNHEFTKSWEFTYFRWTSASTANAWNFIWELVYNYPNLWPESIRWLIIHSASWTNEMINQFWITNLKTAPKEKIQNLVKHVWYWIPNIEKAIYSKENSLTMIAEDIIQPYKKEWTNAKSNEIHFYDLPWPKDELLELWNTEVKMRVTLSYFIDPSPWEKWWKNKYKYQSHALKFDLNNRTESKNEFIGRINLAARDDEYERTTSSWSERWTIGSPRNNWSIHSDTWIWTASELANCNILAVYPLWWWWKERVSEWKTNKKVKYSLIISLETDETEVELYTTIQNKIDIRVPIAIEA